MVMILEKEKHVVIVYPHPDDESFGTAGTIMQLRKKEVPVTYLCGTLGEMGRNMGSPNIANRETLPHIREKELADACKYLDIDYKLLGYFDKMIEFEDQKKVSEHIKRVLLDIEPSLVITHFPPYAIHPDHNALGAATIQAVGMIEEEKRPTLWVQAIEANYEEKLGEPHVINDVSHVFDQKLEAIFQHKSQAYGMIEKMEGNEKEAEKERQNLLARLGKEKFYIWDFSVNGPKED